MLSNSTLAQKYRPLTFKDVLDQEAIITVLKNILKNKKFFSPFMFSGIYGGGKTTLARIFARAIMCSNLTEDHEPCNECSSCKSFLEGTNLAYTEIDAASNSGVDQIRKLRDQASIKVLGESSFKVTVIDECHSITTQGNEALLKQLEDGHENQVYIFCTTAPEKMLETVRSRCFEFTLNKIKPSSISTRLEEICHKEGILYDKSALNTISEICSPHVRDSVKNLDFLSNFGKISDSIVFDHFNLDLNTKYLKIILDLKNNISNSLALTKDILQKTNTFNIYEGLIQSIIKIEKMVLGINEFKNLEQEKLAHTIYDTYQDSLSLILEELLKRNKYADSLVLESDLIILGKKMTLGFGYISNIKNQLSKDNKISTLDSTSAEENISKKEINEVVPNLDTSSEAEPINDKPLEIELEKTSKILNRYKSYPETLALMMDKGKKSSSIKTSPTVQLNQTVKDFKKNLDTDELKQYINTKRLVR
jgi:DNA polymerase III subunit gamma/tau